MLSVPELCLQSFCSLAVRLIWQDMERKRMDARRWWPGLALWVPTGRSCGMHYTHTPCWASKKAAGKNYIFNFFNFFFYLMCEVCWKEAPDTRRRVELPLWCIHSFLCSSPCASTYFLLSTATKSLPVCRKTPLHLGNVESAWKHRRRAKYWEDLEDTETKCQGNYLLRNKSRYRFHALSNCNR